MARARHSLYSFASGTVQRFTMSFVGHQLQLLLGAEPVILGIGGAAGVARVSFIHSLSHPCLD